MAVTLITRTIEQLDFGRCPGLGLRFPHQWCRECWKTSNKHQVHCSHHLEFFLPFETPRIGIQWRMSHYQSMEFCSQWCCTNIDNPNWGHLFLLFTALLSTEFPIFLKDYGLKLGQRTRFFSSVTAAVIECLYQFQLFQFDLTLLCMLCVMSTFFCLHFSSSHAFYCCSIPFVPYIRGEAAGVTAEAMGRVWYNNHLSNRWGVCYNNLSNVRSVVQVYNNLSKDTTQQKHAPAKGTSFLQILKQLLWTLIFKGISCKDSWKQRYFGMRLRFNLKYC